MAVEASKTGREKPDMIFCDALVSVLSIVCTCVDCFCSAAVQK